MYRILSLILAVLLAISPSSVAGAGTTAMLHPTGKVLLNGNEAIGTTAVFPGDRVQTSPGSVAVIADRGSVVSLLPSTSVAYASTRLQLVSGSVRVNTTGAWSLLCLQWTISPLSGGHTEFEVSRLERRVLVSVRTGELEITGPQTAGRLVAGHAMVLREAEAESAGGATAPPPASAGHGSLVPLLVGAAAVATMAVVVLETTQAPLSPSQP